MRTITSVLFAVILFGQFSLGVGQSLIPAVETGVVRIKVTGFERNVYDSQAEKEFDWASFKVNAEFTLESDNRWTMFTQVDIRNIGDNGNYLRLCYVQFAPSTNWLVRAGRNFSAGPYYTTPMMHLLETVKYPREPWGYYNWGVQTEGRFGQGWSLIADISGASGKIFHQEENIDHVEASWRIAKKFGQKIEIGQVAQLSPDFVRAGVNLKYRPTKSLTVTGEYYHQNWEDEDLDGGYLLANWYPLKFLGIHGQIDAQFKGGERSTIATAGVLLRTPKDNVHIIVDFQNSKQGDSLLGCLQFRF
jgi:hypothetical protein